MKQLTIRNFRGIKEGTLNLSPLTMLLGANNSGKSAILEALFIAPNPFREVPYFVSEYGTPYPGNNPLVVLLALHKTLGYAGHSFLLHNYSSKESEIMWWDNTDKTFILRLLRSNSSICFSTNQGMASSFAVDFNGEQIECFGSASTYRYEINARMVGLLAEQTLLINPNLTLYCYEHMRRNWAYLVNTGIMRRVAEETSRLSPDKYIDLTMEPFLGDQIELYAYFKDGRRIRLGDLGAGIQSYVTARILNELANPDILLWDDIESHFNPRILRHLGEWFGDLLNNGKQIIVATHSLEAVNVISGINKEHASIVLVSLDNSVLKTKNLTADEIEGMQNAGIDPRTAEAFMI